jgi:hypothetical protein
MCEGCGVCTAELLGCGKCGTTACCTEKTNCTVVYAFVAAPDDGHNVAMAPDTIVREYGNGQLALVVECQECRTGPK